MAVYFDAGCEVEGSGVKKNGEMDARVHKARRINLHIQMMRVHMQIKKKLLQGENIFLKKFGYINIKRVPGNFIRVHNIRRRK